MKRPETEVTVELDGRYVSIPYLHVDRFAASTPALIEQFSQQGSRDTLPPKLRFDEQVVDIATERSRLHGIAQCQDCVPGSNATALG